MKIHEHIKNLQSLPEGKKVTIMVSVVVVCGLFLGFFWIKSAANNISKAQQSLALSVDLVKIDIPEINVDALNEAVAPEQSVVKVLPTDNWNSHVDAKYNFEIKYPKDWIVQENTKSKEYSLIFCQDNKNGCIGKRVNEENKDENGPMYVFTSKKGNEKPTNLSNHYLGVDSNETEYYLFNEFPKNEIFITDMISTFKLTN